jgi:hypothetical protein
MFHGVCVLYISPQANECSTMIFRALADPQLGTGTLVPSSFKLR